MKICSMDVMRSVMRRNAYAVKIQIDFISQLVVRRDIKALLKENIRRINVKIQNLTGKFKFCFKIELQRQRRALTGFKNTKRVKHGY